MAYPVTSIHPLHASIRSIFRQKQTLHHSKKKTHTRLTRKMHIGWEKLVTEKLCEYYTSDYGIETRIVRFHNIYGPLGTYDGGREKAPAAMCRKVAAAENGGSIEIWGDGEQTRSFCYVEQTSSRACIASCGLTTVSHSTLAPRKS